MSATSRSTKSSSTASSLAAICCSSFRSWVTCQANKRRVKTDLLILPTVEGSRLCIAAPRRSSAPHRVLAASQASPVCLAPSLASAQALPSSHSGKHHKSVQPGRMAGKAEQRLRRSATQHDMTGDPHPSNCRSKKAIMQCSGSLSVAAMKGCGARLRPALGNSGLVSPLCLSNTEHDFEMKASMDRGQSGRAPLLQLYDERIAPPPSTPKPGARGGSLPRRPTRSHADVCKNWNLEPWIALMRIAPMKLFFRQYFSDEL